MLALTSFAVAFQLVTVTTVAGRPEADVGFLRRRLLRRALPIGFGITAFLWIGADVLQVALQTESAWPFRILGLGIPLYLGQAVDRGVVQAEMRFGRLALSYVTEAAVRVAVGLGLVFVGLGVAGATWGLTLSFGASWLAVMPRRSVVAADRPVDRSLAPAAFGPMAILLGAQVVINNGDVLLSKLVFTPEDAGLYAAVALVGRAVFFVSWAIVQVVFPSVAAGEVDSTRLVDQAALALAGFGLVATAGATLTSGTIADLLFGAEYGDVAGLLGPYAAATSLVAVVNLLVTSDVGRGMRRSGWTMLAGAVTQTVVLALFAGGFRSMVWLQVAVMAALLVAVIVVRHRRFDHTTIRFVRPQRMTVRADGNALRLRRPIRA
jgi:O-antigen/teichoic acid export membrane protein